MCLEERLNTALEKAANEREIDSFLKKHLELIVELNEHSWNCVLPKSQFSIGTKYVADYIVLSACSGYWNCVLVEMQSHKDPIFTKDGEESVGLREARKQIIDWRIWIDENESAFRAQLADFAKDEVAHCNRPIHTKASTELRDPKPCVFYKYKVLIGRRSFLDVERNKQRSCASGFEIVTFDRLLDRARKIDELNDYLARIK